MIGNIPGITVGYNQNFEAVTGCTVILTMNGATCGIDQSGGAPCTRDTDALRPMHLINDVHGILLTGGSTFGLAAADGVVQWLEEHGKGFDAGVARIPIVPSAAIFDLAIRQSSIRPDSKMGYSACQSASEEISSQGSIGAGTGATVGHIFGHKSCMKGGLGVEIISQPNGLVIGAIFVVNCFGDIIDPNNGQILAGARNISDKTFVNTLQTLSQMPTSFNEAVSNTVIGVIATNAILNKEEVNKLHKWHKMA